MEKKLVLVVFIGIGSLYGGEHLEPGRLHEPARGSSSSVENRLEIPPKKTTSRIPDFFGLGKGKTAEPVVKESGKSSSTAFEPIDEGWEPVEKPNNPTVDTHEVVEQGDWLYVNAAKKPVVQDGDQLSQSSGVNSETSSLNGSLVEQPVSDQTRGVNVFNEQQVTSVIAQRNEPGVTSGPVADQPRMAEKPSKEAIDSMLAELRDFSRKLASGEITSERYTQKVETFKKQFEQSQIVLNLIDHESSHIVNGLASHNLAFFPGDVIKNQQEFSAWLDKAVSEKRLIDATKKTIESMKKVVVDMQDFNQYVKLSEMQNKSEEDLEAWNRIKGTFEDKEPLEVFKKLETSYAQAREAIVEITQDRAFAYVVADAERFPLATDELKDPIRLRAVVSSLDPATFNKQEKLALVRKMLGVNEDGSGSPLALLERIRHLREQINPIDGTVKELLDNLVVNNQGFVVGHTGEKITDEQLEAIFNDWLPSLKKNSNHTFLEMVTYLDPQTLGVLAKVKEDGFNKKDKNKQLYRDLSLQLGDALNRDYFVKTKLMNVQSKLTSADSDRLLDALIKQNGDLTDKTTLLEQENSFKKNFNAAWKIYQDRVKAF